MKRADPLSLESFRTHGFLVLIIIIGLYVDLVKSQCTNHPVIFNFGDSNSDTGGISAGLGFTFGPPHGRAFFPPPNGGRLSDGRLVIDFLCEHIHTSYLTPYLQSLDPNFSNGANFAISGASTLPEYVPFSLDVQILQFRRFRSLSIELVSRGKKGFVNKRGFENALYTFDIGQNDLSGAFGYLSYNQVVQRIPLFIAEIKSAIWSIYQNGGKNFWIHNTGPLGCLPQRLSSTNHSSADLDQHGCLRTLNDAAKAFNEKLHALCEELRSAMKNATIVYTDIFAIKYDLIANSAKYGFKNPLMACCGYGGPPYNVNNKVGCGQTGYNVCAQGTQCISWDGVHYTEAANSFVASRILSTNYSTPKLKWDYFCNT
ncbi:GDSL esterase/lipase At1g09390-like isoform X1 [Papaver somniferum]|uniref:GDSL esterase/lipase At1g09390-like isoform X1 n=1 Tax=Papaver somniferum TaxID=3469 RepID=UPI000E70560B|nr:GDSL esterase/lipase At1g09390-like isoform X1 [Papaver somniferum]